MAKAATTLDDIFENDDFLEPPKPKARAAAKKAEAAPGEEETPKATTKGGTSLSQDKLAAQAIVKLNQIEKELNDMFFERESEIKSLLIGAISGWGVLFLGSPGTGKTALTSEFFSRFTGAQYFPYLMNPTTDPSELLGPFSIKELEKGNFSRNFQGMLPDAHFAYLDEIYKGNSAALNILLKMINEGTWFNNGQELPVKLHFIVGASNEEPADESLKAFHDRFLFRHWVEYVRDNGNKAKMYKASMDRRNPNQAKNVVKTTIRLDELMALHEKAKEVEFDDQVIKDFQGLQFELSKLGIILSDRRQNVCFELAQAHAALNGRDNLLSEDFVVLVPALWERKDDIAKVESEVLKLANPFEEKMKRFLQQARQVHADTMAIQKPSERAQKAIDARDNLNRIIKEFEKLVKGATAQGRDTAKLVQTRDEVKRMEKDIIDNCLLLVNNNTDDDDSAMPF